MLEYDRLQRAGELLQAIDDEFLGTKTAPSANGSSESNETRQYIVVERLAEIGRRTTKREAVVICTRCGLDLHRASQQIQV